MLASRQQRSRRSRLSVEALEDRTTPAVANLLGTAFDAAGFAADRLNVVMAADANNPADRAELATPMAASVESLGFGIYRVTLAPDSDLAAAVTYYSALPGVVSAAPDQIIQVERTPNDPSYNSLYGMSKISAPTAWDTTTGSGNFVVAVIDSGVDYTHPDLAANMWHNPGEVPGDGIDNDGDGIVDDVYGANFANGATSGNPMDDNGHGTHVSGTIGAVGNNGVGVAGVNWHVKIMAVKFLDSSGSGYTSDAVRALDYAVNHGAKLSNNSWGGGGADSTLSAAIGRARTAGHIFVAAAGNNGSNNDLVPSYPANYIQNYDNVVTVAATDSTDTLASFSNYGASTVTLAAPGVGILSTTPNNTYSTYSGTSMATPHVTGALALFWDANPTLTYQQVIQHLTSSVDPVAGLSGRVATGGRLDVARLIASTLPPPPTTDTAGPRVTASTFSGTSSANFNRVRLTFNEAINPASFDATDVVSLTGPNGAVSTTFTVAPVAGTNNTQFDVTFGTAQTAAGTYSLVVGPNITDVAGNPMNQNNNTVNGENPGDRYTATGTLTVSGTQTFNASGLPLAIRDFQTTTSRLTINQHIQVTDLNVRLSLTHTYDSDLVIKLTGPGGQAVTLANRRGGSGDNFTNTTFDDEATTSIANGAAPFSGSYRPETPLTAFDARDAYGTWTLTVYDSASLDTGTLTAWSLVVTGSQSFAAASIHALGFRDEPAAAPTPVVAVSPTVVPVAVPAVPTMSPSAFGAVTPSELATRSEVPAATPAVAPPAHSGSAAEPAAPVSVGQEMGWYLAPESHAADAGDWDDYAAVVVG